MTVPDKWPVKPTASAEEEESELHKSIFGGVTPTVTDPQVSDAVKCNTWRELLDVTARALHGAADQHSSPTAANFPKAETLIFRQAQRDRSPDELCLLRSNKPMPSSSRLLTLSAEFDKSDEIIRVNGRPQRSEVLDPVTPSLPLMGRLDGAARRFPSSSCLPRYRAPQRTQVQALSDLPGLQACQKWHTTKDSSTNQRPPQVGSPLLRQIASAIWGRLYKRLAVNEADVLVKCVHGTLCARTHLRVISAAQCKLRSSHQASCSDSSQSEVWQIIADHNKLCSNPYKLCAFMPM